MARPKKIQEKQRIQERRTQINQEIAERRERIKELKLQIAKYKDLLQFEERSIKELKSEMEGRYSEELKSNPILRKYIREDIEE